MSRSQLWVFAGPNGAGKSTVVARFRISERIRVVNPDMIAQQIKLGHRNEPSVMLRAGRLAASERRALLKAEQSFAFETTLTGHSEIRVMEQARKAGYKANLVFIGVADGLTALARVREREAVGGHSVPAELVMRRYSKSLTNLPAALRLADRCFILDNTGTRPRLLMTIDGGRARNVSRNLPNWVRRAIPQAVRRRTRRKR
jgi:predicted ABC-type ATPase